MKILVKVCYVKFYFDDINEAVAFAETALKHLAEEDKSEEVVIKLSYEEGE